MLKASLIALLLVFGVVVNGYVYDEHDKCSTPSQIEAPNNQYVVSQLVNFNNKNGQGIQATVSYTGSDEYYKTPNSPIVQNLNMTVTYDSDNEFTILLDDASQPRFKLPYEAPYAYTKPSTLNTPVYSVKVNQNPFSISVIRTATGEVIFDTSSMDFIYSDYYLSFGTTLPSQYLYGLGERRRDFLYDSGLYTIWNKDQYAQIDYGQGGQQTYGTHPMYLMREKSGYWHVVYLRNSNGMDFRYDSGAQTLQYMLTGSVIELKFFFGFELPDQVLKLYHNYINGWTLMPFWSHGYHQSKYGVIYLQDLLDVVGNFTEYKIPIDVIWSDIDYMYSFTDFTIDQERYPVDTFKQLAQSIHWVPIVDAGVSLNATSDAYNKGMEYDPWIKSAENNTNPLVGVVWPGVVHWVDWLHPNASIYWKEMFTEFYNTIPFSGIWLDMNEYSNFCTGEFNNSCNYLADYLPDGVFPYGNEDIPNGDQNSNLPPSPWAWLNSTVIPYSPGGVPLEQKSLPINGLHYNNELELNWHNLNGFLESKSTYEILQTLNGERPFILSRSTHVGSGQYVAHWSGDNYATWDFLKYSISCIFNFQLYGIPMSGDDICGFGGDTTPELCARWMQLGAFYPFMRNHMAIDTTDHYPYSLGDTVLQASIASLKLRYSILKYYYSLFVKNQGVGTVFRPIFFDYPYDESLLSEDTQFLIGSELMVSPVTQQGQQEVSVYFPFGFPWYNFFTGELVQAFNASAQSLTFDAPLNGTLPVFIKGSSVVPVQNTDNVTSTKDLTNEFNLVVAMYPSGSYDFANGQILGISNYSNDASVDKCVKGNSCDVNINVINAINTNGTSLLTVSFQGAYPNTAVEEIYIGNITLYGLRTKTLIDDNVPAVVCDAGQYKLAIPTVLEFQITETGCQASQSLIA